MGIVSRAIETSAEKDRILEKTEIEGLYWISNYYVKTSKLSRIILPSPGQGGFSIVYYGSDFLDEDHGGYEYYGIHVGQVDVLSFLACDDRVMTGHFVDCRKNSQTLHRSVTLEFSGDPEKSLVVERGIAHIFDNLAGMVTLNQVRLYFDIKNKDLNKSFDVINVPRGTKPASFPAVSVNRFRSPDFLCKIIRRKQRRDIFDKKNTEHEFNIYLDEKVTNIIPNNH